MNRVDCSFSMMSHWQSLNASLIDSIYCKKYNKKTRWIDTSITESEKKRNKKRKKCHWNEPVSGKKRHFNRWENMLIHVSSRIMTELDPVNSWFLLWLLYVFCLLTLNRIMYVLSLIFRLAELIFDEMLSSHSNDYGWKFYEGVFSTHLKFTHFEEKKRRSKFIKHVNTICMSSMFRHHRLRRTALQWRENVIFIVMRDIKETINT